MGSDNFFPELILAILLSSIILSLIISFATKTKLRMKHAEAQTLLLTQIALKQGVDPQEVKNIIDSIPS